MSHHISSVRPRGGRESVTSSTAREVLVWFISEAEPNDHTFPAQLGPGDMALSEVGDIWLYNGLNWHLLIASRTDDELRVKNLRVLYDTKGFSIEYEDKT